MKKDFQTYKTDDFILDESFREIVLNKDGNDQLADLVKNYPSKKKEIKIAASIIKELSEERFQQPEKRKHELWLQVVNSQKKKIQLLWLKYAASFLLIIGLGSALFFITRQKENNQVLLTSNKEQGNAILILDNGKQVAIYNKESTVYYSPDGSGIIVNDSSQIEHSASANGVNQLIVPFGKRSFIVLSDGTKVWVNSGSRLTFPSVFSGNSREVTMAGEAFFDVAKDEGKPFFVRNNSFKMKVYGTKFNVQAYNQDSCYNVILVEGKVGLSITNKKDTQEIFLSPNQKASLIKGSKVFEVEKVENTKMYTAWINGYLAFNDEEVVSVLKRVSRYYNVDIEANFPNNMEHIYGKLDLKDDVERVLEGIAFISKTNYQKQGDMYVFSK